MSVISKQKVRESCARALYGILGIMVVLIVWQLAVEYTPLKKIFPYPIDVYFKLIDMMKSPVGEYTLIQHVGISLTRVFVGFTASGIAGITLGILMARSKLVNAIARPFFNMVKPIPGIAWIPLAILWFGIGELTKYFIIFMGGFAYVTINSYDGVKSVDPVLIGAARVLGEKENKLFLKIILPSIVANIFAGLQVSLSSSWMAVLAAEMVSSNKGVGWIILMGMNTGDTPQIMGGMISIGFIGLILATLMRGIERRLNIWKTSD